MKDLSLLGIDTAKTIFQFCGVNSAGRGVFGKRVLRSGVLSTVAQLPPGCTVAMEACSASYYWAREIQKLGYPVKLIPPQFVKLYRRAQKSDLRDAEAICEAASRPNMRWVPVKSEFQQELQSIHRVRSSKISERTATANRIRGFLAEHGVVMPQGLTYVRRDLYHVLEHNAEKIPAGMVELLKELHSDICVLDRSIKKLEERLKMYCRTSPVAKEILKLRGVGPMTATAVIAASGDPKVFKRGRNFSAWLGLVPRHRQSAHKEHLGGITKGGNSHLRTLLIHGARSALRFAKGSEAKDPQSLWMKSLLERKGANIAAVALANKNARVIWALLTKHDRCQLAKAA